MLSGLVAYWSGWDKPTAYRLLDRSPTKNNGTLVNMDAPTDWVGATVNGQSGFALDFDGSNDYINVPLVPALSTLQVPMTIGAWVYKTAGVNGNVFTQYANLVNSRLIKLAGYGTGEFSYYGSTSSGGYQRIAYSTVPALNTWHWLTWIVQGTIASPTCRLGRNGVEESYSMSALSSTPDSTTPLRIACNCANETVAAEFNQIKIAELAIWNRAITQAENRSLYQYGIGWLSRKHRKVANAIVAGSSTSPWRYACQRSRIIGGGIS